MCVFMVYIFTYYTCIGKSGPLLSQLPVPLTELPTPPTLEHKLHKKVHTHTHTHTHTQTTYTFEWLLNKLVYDCVLCVCVCVCVCVVVTSVKSH